MGVDAKRFRERARECRDLVPRAKDPDIRDMLIHLADELEQEADRMDAEGEE